jgi:hypothetical protein
MAEENDAILAYRQLLQRNPDSSNVINDHCQCQSLFELYGRIASSEKFKKKVWDYGSYQFATSFDPIDVILQLNRLPQKSIGAKSLRLTI